LAMKAASFPLLNCFYIFLRFEGPVQRCAVSLVIKKSKEIVEK
jgi:hypothetical protein